MEKKTYANYKDTWQEYCLGVDPNEISQLIIEEYIQAGDLGIHLDIYGSQEVSSPTLLFVHGTAVYARFYAKFLYNMWQKGYRVVAPDLPGHGLSGGKRGHFDMELLVDTLREVISYVLAKYKGPIIMMGSSLGGITTLYTLAADSRLIAGICHNAALLNERAHEKIVQVKGIYKILKPLVPTFARLLPTFKLSVWKYLEPKSLFKSEEFLEKLDVLLNDPLLSHKYTLKALATQMKAVPARPVEEISVPVMILNSDNDVLFSVEYMEEILTRLESSPHKRLEIIPNSSHMILHENTEECAGRVTKWIDEILQSDGIDR